jgi:GNAT superfamily N-acetyltransferase
MEQSADPGGAATPGFTPVVLQLRDGRRVTVRAIRDEDKAAVNEAFQHLSPDSRYSRFMGLVRELSPAMLEATTHPRGERDLALVAVVAVVAESEAEVIVGGARYAASAGGDDCEFAVTVVDDWQGVGLARQLMELLLAAARARGLRTMEGYILTTNASMRGLARRLGFSDMPMAEDPTVRLVRRQLEEPA